MCYAAVDPAVARTEQRSVYYSLTMRLGKAFSLSDPFCCCSLILIFLNGSRNILDISSSSVLAPPKENLSDLFSEYTKGVTEGKI